ncbi:MAG: hypothetical protein ACP5JB_00980 [candidate division WOR-3 bacterium]
MNRYQHLTITICLILVSSALATRYAGDFEDLGTSARAIGMGGAVVAVARDPSAIYYNPALSINNPPRSILLMHSEDFSGIVKHNYLGLVISDNNQAFGAALLHNGIPDIKLTTLPNPDSPPGENNRPYVYKTVNATQLVGYFNYARNLTPLMSVGGNAKIIYQDLGGTASCFGAGIDLGMNLSPLRDLNIGLLIRNLSTSPLFWNTGTRELIYPHAALGIGKKFCFTRNQLLLAVEVTTTEKGLLTNFGAEYSFRDILYARLGFYRNNLSFGLGLRYKRFHIDYGYASGVAPEARELGTPQQISGGVEF